MANELSNELLKILNDALEVPFSKQISHAARECLDKNEIEKLLPHRNQLLLLDRVSIIDIQQQFLVAHYNLSQAQDIFSSYNQNGVIWPPTFQVEAIAQAGALYMLYDKKIDWTNHEAALTHIFNVRFLHPILANEGEVELQVRLFEDGLFNVIIGQCLYQQKICSVAAIKGISQL